MKIIAVGKDGQRPYRMMDDCPRCGEAVDRFMMDYGNLHGLYADDPGLPYVAYRQGPTLTLQPCGCTLAADGSKWNIYQFDTKAAWNKEVVTHELRNKSAEDRKGS